MSVADWARDGVLDQFRDGWAYFTSSRGQPCCGEIAHVTLWSDYFLCIRLRWSAQQFANGWFLTSVSERAFVDRLCDCRVCEGADTGTIEIDYPHLDEHIVLCPPRHRRISVGRENVKPPPT